MTDTRALTCVLELHAHLTEKIQENSGLRNTLAEKERTIQLQGTLIVKLQRQLADMTEPSGHEPLGSRSDV